ncbi:MAG: Bax inhibitor-1 family protein [Proteobacteria bacterium]|nr:Bax inhibitor-1 family protein [Pseudomonadota bacterium]MDE3208648.1 Bax inhibitor-1 family protein [Pseudomonadota bacterium]
MFPNFDITSPSASGQVRNKVMRSTMYLLSASLIPTVLGSFFGMTPAFIGFMLRSPIMASIAMLAVMFILVMGIQKNRNSRTGIALLLFLTFAMGVWLGPLLAMVLHSADGAVIVAEAAGGTAVIFASLATIATVTRKDFSFMSHFLFIGLILLIIASFANLFLHIPAMQLTIAAIAILVFSGYLLFDLSRIVTGGETNYVVATLALYLDLYNIFVNLLYLLSALSGNNRR